MLNYMPKLVDRATYSRTPRGRAFRATPEQIAAWQALARAYSAVGRISESALTATGLEGSDYDVLSTLGQGPPEGLRPTELAERVLLTKSGLSRLVERLAERELIERRPCATDRRGQLVALTPTGRRLLRRAAPEVLRQLRIAMGSLSDADLAALQRASERIKAAVASTVIK